MSTMDIDSASSVEEVRQCLVALDHEEDRVADALDELLSHQEGSVDGADGDMQKLSIIKAMVQKLQFGDITLLRMLHETSSKAERISRTVYQIESEQSRVKECLKHVEEVQELKSAISQIHSALESKEWETAAKAVHRARAAPEAIITGKLALQMVPSSDVPESPAEYIEQVSEQLHGLFKREFEHAASTRDQHKISRFFKLFPLIGREASGLQTYTSFVATIITTRVRAVMAESDESPMFYARAFQTLLENIARILDQHSPVVQRYYGQESIATIVEMLQVECQSRGSMILDTFWDQRRISRKLSDVRSFTFTFLSQTLISGSAEKAVPPEDELVTTADVDALLRELVQILTNWALYSKFIALKMTPEKAVPADQEATHGDSGSRGAGDMDEMERPGCITGLEIDAMLSGKFREAYETMELWFARRSVEKAFQLNTYDRSATPPVSTAVDDVMYIVKLVIERAVCAGNAVLFANIVNGVKRILEGDHAAALKRLWMTASGHYKQLMDKMSYATGAPAVAQSGSLARPLTTAETDAREKVLIATNNFDLSREYLSKIIETRLTDPSIQQTFVFGDDSQQVMAALRSLATTRIHFEGLLANALDEVFQTEVRPRLRLILSDSFRDLRFILSHAEFEELMMEHTLLERFKSIWNNAFDGVRPTLSDAALVKLTDIALSAVVHPMERKLMSLKCNEMGAIYLESEVQAIIAYVSPSYKSRDKFARVLEVVLTLNHGGSATNANGNNFSVNSDTDTLEKVRAEMLIEHLTDEQILLVLKNRVA